MQLRVEKAAGIRNSERYWALMVSLSLTGGAIAKQLGLHDIPIKPVFDYAINLIKEARARGREYAFDSDEFLGSFLQKRFHEILVINGRKDSRTGLDHSPIKEPRGALTARYEPDTKMLFVVVSAYRAECSKTMLNYNETLEPYIKNKALIATKRKRMLQGTSTDASTHVNALCFDTTKLEFFNEEVLLDNERVGTPAAD